MHCSPSGSSVHGILPARILEWVATSFSNSWKWKVKGKSLSSVRLFATPWTAAYQAPPSMEFSRQESDATERLPFHFSLSWIGEGNGSPLQCSCLENPRDGRDWWAAVYGVAQSRTRLKRLSSSSSSILMSESQKRISSTKHYKVLPTSTLFITLVSFNQNLPQMAYGFHRNVFKLLIYKCVQSEYMTERSCFLRDSGIKFLKLKIPMCSRK